MITFSRYQMGMVAPCLSSKLMTAGKLRRTPWMGDQKNKSSYEFDSALKIFDLVLFVPRISLSFSRSLYLGSMKEY